MKNNFTGKRQLQKPAIPAIPQTDSSYENSGTESSFSSAGSSSSRQEKKSRFPLGLLASLCALLLVPSLVSVLFGAAFHPGSSIAVGTAETFETAAADPGNTSIGAPSTQLTQLTPVLVKDNLIVTYQIDKTKFADVSFSLDCEGQWGDYTDYGWVNSSSMGFETPQVFVSAVLSVPDDISSEKALDATLTTSYKEYYTLSESDYDYLMDDFYLDQEEKEVNMDPAVQKEISSSAGLYDGDSEYRTRFLEQYRQFSPEKYSTLTLDSDSVDSQNGIVTFTVTNPASNYISGAVNIVYKKNGQVVFGDVYTYHSTSSTSSKTFAYTPPCELPAYDEVVLIDMHA